MFQCQDVRLVFVGILVGVVFVAVVDWRLLANFNVSANVSVQSRAKQMLQGGGLSSWNLSWENEEWLVKPDGKTSLPLASPALNPVLPASNVGRALTPVSPALGSVTKETTASQPKQSSARVEEEDKSQLKTTIGESVRKTKPAEAGENRSLQGATTTLQFPNWKGTRLTDPKLRPPDDDAVHRTGGPVWPPGSASSYDWSKAVMTLYSVPKRKQGLKETIFALDPERRKPCGKKCIAHCLVGQPREMVDIRGLWKSAKHRLFDAMSPVEDRVVFGALSVSGATSGAIDEGSVGYLRANIGAVSPERLIDPMKYMDVDRALFMDEKCTTGKCLSKSSGIVCAAKPLGLTNLFDKRKGVVANVCDIQFRRFQTCVNLVREYEKDYSMGFSWITRHRPDVYWTRNAGPVWSMSTKYVYLHGWAACGYGGGDWFYFASRDKADIIARFADEFSCEHYLQKGILPDPCRSCLGCECSIVAWLLKNKVEVKVGPYNDCIPAKFCGGGCPPDWKPKFPHNKKTNLTGYSPVGSGVPPRKPKKVKKSRGGNTTDSAVAQ